MTDAIVEAVARALCDHANHKGDYDANVEVRGPGWRLMARAAIAAYEREAKPVAYMRKWAFDGIDVMKLKKPERPAGWAFYATTTARLLKDDVPLFALPSPPPEGQ